jgi:uncharacterized protein YndB with AHSA1/START domain
MSDLKLVRQIAARPDIVFDAISTDEGIRHWFGPDAGPVLIAEMDLRVGGHFKVRFRMLDRSEHECSGEILELARPTRLVISWAWLGREADGESRVEFLLRPTAQGTELIFTHTQLPDEQAARDHERGWNGALDKLERYVNPTR